MTAWCEQVGSLAEGLPVQRRTGREGGGFQVWLRCPEPGHNDKLAHVPDASEETGRRVAIETRAEGGYAVMPGSLHPSGNTYRAIAGDFANIPTYSRDRRIRSWPRPASWTRRRTPGSSWKQKKRPRGPRQSTRRNRTGTGT